MKLDGIALEVTAWLLTYAVHSTLLLGATWLFTRRLFANREALKDRLWKTALVGGVLTASLQTGLAVEPGGGLWHLGDKPVAKAPVETPRMSPAAAPRVASPDMIRRELESREIRARIAPLAAPVARVHWSRWALGTWAAGGLGVFLLVSIAARRLRDRLAGRRPLESGHLPGLLAQLRRRAGVRRPVRLSVSPRLHAPIAMGVVFPQICLPERSLHGLSREMQESMLAHELGHIARFDPLWLGICRWLETLLFFQPLNRVARLRWSESAEFLCDAWAVRQTGNRVGLARCLAEVAVWITGERRALPACGMANGRSRLGDRVERILKTKQPAPVPRGSALAFGTALALTVLFVPGFARNDAARTERTDVKRRIEPARLGAERGPASAERRTSTVEVDPRPATPQARLAELNTELDAELGGLEQELAVLHVLLEESGAAPALRQRLAEIDERARLMRERKESIRSMLETLFASDIQPTADSRSRESVSTREEDR